MNEGLNTAVALIGLCTHTALQCLRKLDARTRALEETRTPAPGELGQMAPETDSTQRLAHVISLHFAAVATPVGLTP
jgi:hypothetical protein